MDAEKTMHTPDLNPTIIYDQEGGKHLANEFFYRSKYEDVIFQSQKKDDHGSRNKILEFGRIFKIDSEEASKNKSCKNANATQGCNRDMMKFAGIGHFKKFLHVRHINNYGNRQKSYGE